MSEPMKKKMNESIAILCGGGPAPGINTVISTVSKVFLDEGYRVIGIHEGYKGLFKNGRFEEINFDFADKIYSRGGSALQMSRFKPKDEDFTPDFFVNNNVKLLVTIGGDDTASTANRITKYLESQSISIQNIHVPKTIDNDLPLPEGIPTFGYHSAKDEGVRIGTNIYEDARTSGSWFIISAMGREAGHLAFGIGTSCHFPMIIIPEMFDKTELTLKKIVSIIISSMLKRTILGINHGVIIVSEGVFHGMTDEEIETSGINFTYDEHGHPELGNVSKSHIFNLLVQRRLRRLGINIKSRPDELGYELRCCRPIAYDLNYCTMLGIGVKKLFKDGKTGCMVTIGTDGSVSPLYLKDVEDEKGKVKPRLVNINSEKARLVYSSQLHYITPADYEAARKYVPDPEDYDFKKILNWQD
jgi:ATP-dependent phosphofructokinase / diphosphate-dependent phosphofructokinase